MGVGRTLSSRQFTTARARAAIAAILSPSLESKAAKIGAQVSRENGADAAADRIASLLIARD